MPTSPSGRRAGPAPRAAKWSSVAGKVALQRPRVRTAAGEVALPTFEAMAATDPLDRRVVEQMLVGVATRQYARSLEPVGPDMKSRGTSKSAVSRRFVARTTAQLAAWQSAPLDGLDLVALLIDGVHLGDHCLIVALGIAADGQKHALGLWDGSTENATVCQGLLANLQSRGLRTDRSLLVILDGSKALRKAVRATFGDAALVQRCQVHEMRNILEYLNDRQRPWAQAILRRAYQSADVKTAQRLLLDLARRLETEHPSAAESVREGLDETLTVLTLNSPRGCAALWLPPTLRRVCSVVSCETPFELFAGGLRLRPKRPVRASEAVERTTSIPRIARDPTAS
jgi:putative transposase